MMSGHRIFLTRKPYAAWRLYTILYNETAGRDFLAHGAHNRINNLPVINTTYESESHPHRQNRIR